VRIGLASFLIFDKQGERFSDLTVVFATGIIKERDQRYVPAENST
jgi:hypothetical protein